MASIKVCVHCGYTWEEVLKEKKAGCAECYNIFSDEIKEIKLQFISRIDMESQSDKKLQDTVVEKRESSLPNEAALEEKPKPKNTAIELKEELTRLIQQEKFEEAAKIRDEIARIKDNGSH